MEVPDRSPPTVDLLLLTWASGTMDALSYLGARVFTANMTGNTVLLGLAIIGPDRSQLQPCIIALSAFSIGVLLAEAMLRRKATHRDARLDLTIGILLELPFAIAFTLLSWLTPSPAPRSVGPALIGTAACALGIQSVAVRRLKISGVATTFITGTITTAIISLLETTDTEPSGRSANSSPGVLALMLFFYILAAALAASLATNHGKTLAALIPSVSLSIVLLRMSLCASRSEV